MKGARIEMEIRCIDAPSDIHTPRVSSKEAHAAMLEIADSVKAIVEKHGLKLLSKGYGVLPFEVRERG